MWRTNKQWPCRGSAWEISVTLMLECRPGGEQKASIWMSGLREVPGKSSVLTHTAELHSPALIGSRRFQVFSWLLPGKMDTKTVRKIARRVGWGEEAGVSVCVCGGVGRLEKKGRMLRTVAEEVRGISSRVPTVSLGQSWVQLCRYSSGLSGGSVLLTLMLKAAGKRESCAKTVLEPGCPSRKALGASGALEEHSAVLEPHAFPMISSHHCGNTRSHYACMTSSLT